jgi:GNAT superfamily N-acetyltransferase
VVAISGARAPIGDTSRPEALILSDSDDDKLSGTVVVRRRTDDDFAALVQITASVRAADDYPTYLPGDDYHRFLSRPESLAAWVAERDGRICGHVALNAQASPGAMQVVRDAHIDVPIGAVARLLVDPGFRRQGVAGELLQTVRAAALSQQRTPVIEVVDSSHAAIALYRSAGWVELGRTTLSLPDGRELSELVFATDT